MSRLGFLWRFLHAVRCPKRQMFKEEDTGCVECRYCGWSNCRLMRGL